MKIGVLGTGFGAYHIKLYSMMEGVEAVYVFGRNLDKLNELNTKYGSHIVTDINEIMNNDEIDFIDICLPNELHREYAILAMKHGKHVFCETPIAYSLEDAYAMQEAKQKYGKHLMVNLFLRFEYAYEVLASFVQEGKFGNINKIQIQRYTPPLWGDLGLNKIVTDLMIHDIDFVSYLLGSTDKVQVAKVVGTEGQCAVSAICTYDNAFAEINASSMMPYGYPFAVSYEVIFEQAVVRYFEDGYENRLDAKLTVFTENKQEEIPLIQNNCYEKCLNYVLQIIKTSKIPINDVSEAVKSLEIANHIKKLITFN